MRCKKIILSVIGNIADDEFHLPLDDIGIDSIDLVNLRVELDSFYKRRRVVKKICKIRASRQKF